MITQQEFYVYFTDYTKLIDSMALKLTEAKRKFPNNDFTESEKAINSLRFLRELFHNMYHDQQTIENDSGRVIMERHRLMDKIIKLEQENTNLKKDIIL